MTDAALLEKLVACAEAIEDGIARTERRLAEDIAKYRMLADTTPLDMTDTNGRPILANMYADLGRVLAAIAEAQRRG